MWHCVFGLEISKERRASIFKGQAGPNNLILEDEYHINVSYPGEKKVENRELKGKFGADREVEREELRGVEISEWLELLVLID